MIRYVSEKQVDLNPAHSNKKHRSHQKILETASQNAEMAEDLSNSSKALKILKKANDQSEMLKGRLSVLQIHQQKNDFRTYLNSERYKFHQHMRNQMERQREEKALHLKRVMQKLNQSQEQARHQRLQHQMNLKRAQYMLYSQKNNDYKMTKQKTEEIQNNLSMWRQSQEERKKHKKEEIREYEKSQKVNVVSYLQNKKKEFKETDGVDSMKLLQITQQRRKQIESLAKMQSQMLERQARSKMSCDESANKLKHLLTNKKAVSTSHTTKLPQLGNPDKKNASEQDLFVL